MQISVITICLLKLVLMYVEMNSNTHVKMSYLSCQNCTIDVIEMSKP